MVNVVKVKDHRIFGNIFLNTLTNLKEARILKTKVFVKLAKYQPYDKNHGKTTCVIQRPINSSRNSDLWRKKNCQCKHRDSY